MELVTWLNYRGEQGVTFSLERPNLLHYGMLFITPWLRFSDDCACTINKGRAMKVRLVCIMEVWGAATICEGWSTFFSLLSHLLIEVKRDVTTYLTITKVDFYLSELHSRLSCLLSLLALLGTEEEPSVADSDEREIQFVHVHIVNF